MHLLAISRNFLRQTCAPSTASYSASEGHFEALEEKQRHKNKSHKPISNRTKKQKITKKPAKQQSKQPAKQESNQPTKQASNQTCDQQPVVHVAVALAVDWGDLHDNVIQGVTLQITSKRKSDGGKHSSVGWLNGWINEWMNRWIDERINGWNNGWMDGWIDGWINGWIDGLMDEGMDEWMDGWIDGWGYE